MEIKGLVNFESENFSGLNDVAVIALVDQDSCENFKLPDFLNDLQKIFNAAFTRKDFTGKKGKFLRVPVFDNANVRNLYLFGLGEKDKCNSNLIRDSLAWAFRAARNDKNKNVLLLADGIKYFCNVNEITAEAAGLSAYDFDKYKSKKDDENSKPAKLDNIFIHGVEINQNEIQRGEIFASSQVYSRDLINIPGCDVNPVIMAEKAQALAKDYGLEIEIYDEKKLLSENMGGILAVGKGSAVPPRLIHLKYAPKNPRKKIVFVGKGITFDSGGLDIKPENFMLQMKCDKTGACNVLGILKAVADLKPDIEIHGILACAENMPSGNAFRPDDIIKIHNGKTVEINNTDAEGRLVLADGLSLASDLKPDVIIDMATLTGACAVALGNWRAGLFVNDEELSNAILTASKKSGEAFWRMPHEDEHIEETLKSPFADLTNCGKRYGGAIFAAIFLSNFVAKDIAWAHLDLAGVDYYEKEYGIYSKGASAFGVRTCLEYVMNL